MLFFNDKIKTRTSFVHPVQFGEILHSKQELYSFSFFNDSLINEINFKNKTLEIWKFSDNCFVRSYEKFSLSNNMPLISVSFNLETTNQQSEIKSFYCQIRGKDWNTADIIKINDSSVEFSFNRVFSYLGNETNCYFGQKFILENSIIKETHTIKNNNKNRSTEIILALSHSYQFKEYGIENTAKNILQFGWNEFDVTELLRLHKK